MLADDSPYRRLPHALDRKQVSFIVGIRYSAEMIDLAYRQLVGHLQALGLSARGGPAAGSDAHTGAVMNAWSIVDSANRLRVLLDSMPGVTKSQAEMQVFLRQLKPLEELRNPIQHLNGQIHRLVNSDTDLHVWGSLAWSEIIGSERAQSFVLLPGSIRSARGFPVVNPAGREFRSAIDHVTLDAHGASANLSDVVYAVADLIKSTEPALVKQFEGHETMASDLLVAVEFAFDSAPEPASPSTEARPA